MRLDQKDIKELELFKNIIRSSPELMTMLRDARSLDLKYWCIGAGAIRNYVWDSIQGNAYTIPNDVDLIHYDNDLSSPCDLELTEKINLASNYHSWEVTNQARVHEWYESQHGQNRRNIRSINEGVSTWPEYCTAVGVSLRKDDSLIIYAPFGLGDLLEFKVRHNPLWTDIQVFEKRLSKFCKRRWPLLDIQHPASSR